MRKHVFLAVLGLACTAVGADAQAQDCAVAPMTFNSHIANIDGEMTVKAGKGCGFGLNGIQGAIREAAIVQKPKTGMAGVQGHHALLRGQAGLSGTGRIRLRVHRHDQYGGPMRVTIENEGHGRSLTGIPVSSGSRR